MAVHEEMAEILKPRTDKRDYKRIVLPNSLEILLISDPDTDKCAASMNVNVGSFCDPEGLEGLAHFLEHMLFYASEKYPIEDSYSKYITEHGGSTNAFTASEYTNYFFDVNADSFEEALDRFAQFFIKPLMSPDATMREIKAVDSEHQKNLLSDGWRINQLKKHLSSPTHPYHKFSTGSWETLAERPKAKGIDTRDELIKFYKEYYSANLMRLVVYSKDSLDKIERVVESKFKDIPNTNRNTLSFPGQPCTSDHLQILVKTVPIKDGHNLRFMWPITPSIRYYKEGPCRYLGHVIGHEAEGSLFYILKKLGWAFGLSAGETDFSNDYSFFKVGIELTDAGHKNMQNVVGLLFKYIQLVQKSGVCEWIFNELSAICETSFHFQDKNRPSDYVVDISSNMQLYPPRDWLARSSLPSTFNPSTIQMILDELNPENVRIFWESKTFEGHTDLAEPWYGTCYSHEKISSSTIQQWMSCSPNENLHLPAANVFIPTDLSIKDFKDKVTYPTLLRTSSYSRLWYKPDTMFFIPKAYVKIDFHCPHAGNSPESEVLTDIFTRLLTDYLNEYAYDAQVAGLHYGINHTDCGFEVTVTGYNHKLGILLDTIVDMIVKFEVRSDRFAVIKETVLKQYQNFKFQQPYQQAMYYCSLILQDNSWPWMEQLEILPNLEADALSKFVPLMLSKAFLECYFAGNIEQGEAESTIEKIESAFFKGSNPLCQPLFPSQYQTNRVVKLGKGKRYCYSAKGLNPTDENSCLIHCIQAHQDEYLANVKLELIALVAKQPTFHQLRSVEQLGYITVLMKRNIFGIHGLQFIIQSTAKGPSHIDQRVEAFLGKFEGELRQLSEDEFKKNLNSLVDSKLEKHKNLREESRFFWKEITDGTFKFDRRESEVSALKQLTQKELVEFFDEFIKVDAPRKKSVSVMVYGSSHLSDYEADKTSTEQAKYVHIDDIFTFRRTQPLYGSFRGGRTPTKL
ncbi:insulin-degrading enzyme-like 1, peroxisomal [Chenopodium quinoa]|uniref:insulin-degrading enzyme-like 1, peroxisomal n=1 Tax=Chenopodium quinoa TaxID=63459 RepID=UPI000B7833DD|nr:insulin-degrading enzyme-like 1, peroxisomal [Chenopodium quinoa]